MSFSNVNKCLPETDLNSPGVGTSKILIFKSHNISISNFFHLQLSQKLLTSLIHQSLTKYWFPSHSIYRPFYHFKTPNISNSSTNSPGMSVTSKFPISITHSLQLLQHRNHSQNLDHQDSQSTSSRSFTSITIISSTFSSLPDSECRHFQNPSTIFSIFKSPKYSLTCPVPDSQSKYGSFYHFKSPNTSNLFHHLQVSQRHA